jgi:hypothetical protein
MHKFNVGIVHCIYLFLLSQSNHHQADTRSVKMKLLCIYLVDEISALPSLLRVYVYMFIIGRQAFEVYSDGAQG